jgi:hypothetical protein
LSQRLEFRLSTSVRDLYDRLSSPKKPSPSFLKKGKKSHRAPLLAAPRFGDMIDALKLVCEIFFAEKNHALFPFQIKGEKIARPS